MITKQQFGRWFARALIGAASALLLFDASVHGGVVLDWNAAASDTLAADTTAQNPGMASRTMAMMNLAMHDSVRVAEAKGTSFYNYSSAVDAYRGAASSVAAAAQSAYSVLSSIYPARESQLRSQLDSSLASIMPSAAKEAGIALGRTIGQSIVARRQNDGYDSSSQYTPSDKVGHWRPDPMNPSQEAWGPEWGKVKTFALQSNRQFMPGPMPELTSQAYADSFNEVKELGSLNSTVRTAEQTEIGIFWAYDREGMGTPMRLYNQAMRNIAEKMGGDTFEHSEMFAKAAVAAADAGIVAWNAKFEYDFWRPISAIREADLDGNPLTEADPLWIPLGAPGGTGNDFTPPFPTYISGHATFGAAIFESLKEYYGTDEIAFSLSSDELGGLVRNFSKLSEAIAENGRSRVYLGIHFDFDDLVARETGRNVAHITSLVDNSWRFLNRR